MEAKRVKDVLDTEDNISEMRPRKRYFKHKLEKKVTVKHFLNKKIVINKNEKQSSGNLELFDEPIFPVYIQITFNRKTTTIKSATNQRFSEREYDKALKSKLFLKLFERERLVIEFHFQSSYKEHLELLSKQFKLQQKYSLFKFESFEDEYNDFLEQVANEFDINRFFKEYSYSYYEIHQYVDMLLYEEVIKFLKEIALKEKSNNRGKHKFEKSYSNIALFYFEQPMLDIRYMGGIKVSALELLSFLEMKDNRFYQLKMRFPSEIWHFTLYYGFLMNDSTNSYKSLPATILDFTGGNFKTEFLSAFKNEKEKIQLILNDIETLIKKIKYVNIF